MASVALPSHLVFDGKMKRFLIKSVIASILTIATMFYFGSRYEIALVGKEIRCLDGTVFIVDHKDPSVEKGNLVAVYPGKDTSLWIRDEKVDDEVKQALVKFIKFVAALPGDKVMVKDKILYINGEQWGRLALLDRHFVKGTAETYEGTFTVQPGQLLVLGTNPRSFDGRYWGTISDDNIIGRAYRIY